MLVIVLGLNFEGSPRKREGLTLDDRNRLQVCGVAVLESEGYGADGVGVGEVESFADGNSRVNDIGKFNESID